MHVYELGMGRVIFNTQTPELNTRPDPIPDPNEYQLNLSNIELIEVPTEHILAIVIQLIHVV